MFFVLFTCSFLYASTVEIGNLDGKIYRFDGNLRSCENQPHDAKEENAQGMAHYDLDKIWFMASKSKLKVYGGFFSRDKTIELLNDDCPIGEKCYTYAEHLGDIDFDQEEQILYIPLEHLNFLEDYSGYSMYKWDSAYKKIDLKKLVVLEEGRGGSSAPYVAYNSIDKLVYLHGYNNTNSFLILDKCKENRICGYNPDTTETTTIKTLIGDDVSIKIAREHELLKKNLEIQEYVRSLPKEVFEQNENSQKNALDDICPNIRTKEKCENHIRKEITRNQKAIDFLENGEDFTLYKTTEWAEKVIVMIAKCGNNDAWVKEPDRYREIIYNNSEYCEVDHSLDSAFTKQGAVFSPNHRFLFYVHHSDTASKALLHVYYFPDSEWIKFHESNLKEPIYAVYAGIIPHEINPTMAGYPNEELEGVDVWNGMLNGRQCDLHEMMLDNDGLSNDEYYIWHWLFQDSDGDEITDLYDNCIFVKNSTQLDSDGDGLGDDCDKCPDNFDPDQKDSDDDGVPNACDRCKNYPDDNDIDQDGIPDECDNCPFKSNPDQKDSDGDGIGNACDNCPEVKNPREMHEMNSEFVLAQKKGAKDKGFCKNRYSSTWESRNICMMQPDSDLDGIGDKCDYGNIENGGFANSKIESVRPSAFISSPSPYFYLLDRTVEEGRYVTISLNMPENSGRGLDYCKQIDENNIDCNAAVHYCAINNRDYARSFWGIRGYCSTSEKEGGSSDKNKNFGYSHGSDDFSQESIRSWQSRISVADSSEYAGTAYWKPFINSEDPNNDPKRKPVKVSTSGKKVLWNWRRDWYEINDCKGNPNSSLCQNLLNGGEYNEENSMYYALSTSILPVKDDNLKPETIPDYTSGKGENLAINNAYFPPTNTNKFARAARYNLEANELNFHTRKFEMPNFSIITLPDIELCPSCYFDIPIRIIGQNDILPVEYISRYFIEKDNKNNMLPKSQRIVFPQNLVTFSELSKTEMIGILRENNEHFLSVNTVESGSDWNKIGKIENWDSEIAEIQTFAANFFVAKNQRGVKKLYSIDLISEIPQNIEEVAKNSELPEIVYNLNNLGAIGFESDKTKLVFANGKLYLFAQNENNFGMLRFNGENFEEIHGVMPLQRELLNILASGKYLFLAGGTDFSNKNLNDLWRFDTETNTWEQIHSELKGSFGKVIMQDVDGKIVGFNPVIDENTSFPAFEFENLEDIENIEVSEFEIENDFTDFEQNFCLSDSDSSIFPGITNFYGECRKVENYDFDEITFPDYKFSVAGYKNNLYLGGLTGIRRLEIGEDGEITKKEIVYSGETNNLAVFGNTLYAANYSEIDIFEIADDGKIERKSSIKTNNCKNIRIYGNRLFAAENKRIRIFDLSDPLSPELLKTISLGNKAEDLEIAGNELFVYENLNGLLTRKGKVSVFDIADIENPQKLNDFSQYCNDPEMQKSGNTVYLGCKNGTFKVTGSGLQGINGSKNYLRDSYVFDGILYQVFSGTLHKSQVKTEEIEEDGWI